MKPCAVYYLVDPETYKVRYVGVTVNPVKRFESHRAARGLCYRDSWVKSLRLRGLLPTLRIVAWVHDIVEAKRIEIALILRFPDLTNLTRGGDGGNVAPESRAAMSISHRGVKLSDNHRAAQRAGQLERYKDPRARAALAKSISESARKPGARERRIIASTGRIQSVESREAISKTLMGHGVSPATREKLRLSTIGRVVSENTRKKMSASHVGHKVSHESRAKSRVTHLKRAIANAEQELVELRTIVNNSCVGAKK